MFAQRRRADRRRLGALRASAPTASATASAPPITASQNAAANRDFCDASLPSDDAERRQFRAADARRLPAADRHRSEGLCRHGRRARRAWPAGTPISRSATATTASTITVRNTLNTSFGTASQSVFDAGGLRYGQIVANLDFSRQFEVGLAKPLSVAVGAEYRNENFKIRPGELAVLCARAAVPRRDHHHRGQLHDAGRRLQRRHRRLQLPGPRSAGAGAQGFPGIPAGQRDRREPPQLRRLCRARHRSVRGLHRHPRRPLRAFLRLRQHRERQARAALRAGPGLCGARLDLERLPRAVAPPAILHHHLDQLHRRPAGRHQHASRSTARSRARSARRDLEPEKSRQPQRRRDRQSAARPHPHRRLSTASRSTTASS